MVLSFFLLRFVISSWIKSQYRNLLAVKVKSSKHSPKRIHYHYCTLALYFLFFFSVVILWIVDTITMFHKQFWIRSLSIRPLTNKSWGTSRISILHIFTPKKSRKDTVHPAGSALNRTSLIYWVTGLILSSNYRVVIFFNIKICRYDVYVSSLSWKSWK